MISSTTKPRSRRETSWRALVSTALALSSLDQFRFFSARRRSRLKAAGCCWQMLRSIGRSSALRQASSALRTGGGMTLTVRRAKPRSMINVSPIIDASKIRL